MGARNNMLLAFEKLLARTTGQPSLPRAAETDHRLDVSVIFTSDQATVAALKGAGAMAGPLGVRITLVVPQTVPFPLPLNSPPVLLDFSERRFSEIAAATSVETRVCLYLCRDRLETLCNVLPRRSPVLLGGRKRWWPTAEKKLARQLRRAGFEVIYTEME